MIIFKQFRTFSGGARGVFAVGAAWLAGACDVPAGQSAPAFGGKGAILDPGPAAGAVEAKDAPTDPCASPAPASEDPRLDDFEDGDNRLFGGFEREGYWYSASDHSPESSVFPAEGKFEPSRLPAAEATLGNVFAAHFAATGEKDWGATWGTTLRHVGPQAKCALNVGNFRGLRFRARGKGTVSLRFGMPETVSTEYGGRCVERCWDKHGIAIRLSDEWQKRDVYWEQLQQGGWGKSVRFDPKRLLDIEFMASPVNLPADLWIDDLDWIRADGAK